MKKKISIVISLAFLFISFISCEQEDQINSLKSVDTSISVDKNSMVPLEPTTLSKEAIEEKSCGDPMEVILYAGQHIKVGKVLISNSEDALFITYDVSGSSWWLSETHLFAGDIDDAPFTKTGNPKIGHFPYHGDHDLTQVYTFAIPLEELDDEISIIAHGVVVKKEEGQAASNETAFGYGDIEFQGSRWGWIINYDQQDCEDHGEDSTNDDNETDNNTGTGDNGNIGSGENENGCMDAYAFSSSSNSTCFLNDFDTWGWTNSVPYDNNFYYPGGVTNTYPLYASAFQCDIDNSMLVGEVKINISGGDSVLYAKVTVTLTNRDLSITDLHIYAGTTPYPMDRTGNPSISFDTFDIVESNLNVKTYSTPTGNPEEWLQWFDNSNFIVHVKVCPEP